MKKLIEKGLHILGAESRAEKKRWKDRNKILGETALLGVYTDRFKHAQEAEIAVLKEYLQENNLNMHDEDTTTLAQERVRLRALCLARCALPASGVRVPQLLNMGFEVPPEWRKKEHPGDEYCYSQAALIPVEFPEGWSIEPNEEEPSLSNASYATVFDNEGQPRINVLYQYSTNDNLRRAHSQIIEQ